MSVGRYCLGLGCDRGTPAATVLAAIDEALAVLGVDVRQVARLASIDLKADEAAMQAVSEHFGLPVQFYAAVELATVPVPNPSETVRRHTGTPSVSEAAALRVAGVDMTQLVVEKYKKRGADGRNATVSVARLPA